MTEGHAAVLEKDFAKPKEHETEFSHIKPGDTEFKGRGLARFFSFIATSASPRRQRAK